MVAGIHCSSPGSGVRGAGNEEPAEGTRAMPEGESLFHRYPDYRVDIDPNPARVRVGFNGETVADSEATLVVRETRHEPVLYFPRSALRSELFELTDHQSFCPFKGKASYWTLRVADRCEENVAWSYEDPFSEVAGLRNYVAFYSDRVEFREGS